MCQPSKRLISLGMQCWFPFLLSQHFTFNLCSIQFKLQILHCSLRHRTLRCLTLIKAQARCLSLDFNQSKLLHVTALLSAVGSTSINAATSQWCYLPWPNLKDLHLCVSVTAKGEQNRWWSQNRSCMCQWKTWFWKTCKTQSCTISPSTIIFS